MQKKRKGYWSVSEIGPSPPPPPLNVDADGRVGIWKAPLPGGTAELKKLLISVSEIGPSPP